VKFRKLYVFLGNEKVCNVFVIILRGSKSKKKYKVTWVEEEARIVEGEK